MTLINFHDTGLSTDEARALFAVLGWEERVLASDHLWLHWTDHQVRDDWPEVTLEELLHWLHDHDCVVTIEPGPETVDLVARMEFTATHITGEHESYSISYTFSDLSTSVVKAVLNIDNRLLTLRMTEESF